MRRMKRIKISNLAEVLKKDLKDSNKKSFDIVAFTHADDDHIHNSTEFFYLDHAKKYQSNERIKIDELWVPAAMVIDTEINDEAKILRAEARYRLKKGKGIKVFSRPEKLKEWLDGEGLTIEERLNCIVDAGKTIPGFSKKDQGVEFFVHSPFAKHSESDIEDKNIDSLILQATFLVEDQETKFLIIGDTESDILAEIVEITKLKNGEERLKWDIYDIPHHCSYKALNKDDKGEEKTEPIKEVKWLLEQGQKRGLLISCSEVNSSDDKQPPHKEAKATYKDVANSIGGEFIITMEYPPKKSKPEPLVIIIGKSGLSKEEHALGATVITSTPSPRFGLK